MGVSLPSLTVEIKDQFLAMVVEFLGAQLIPVATAVCPCVISPGPDSCVWNLSWKKISKPERNAIGCSPCLLPMAIKTMDSDNTMQAHIDQSHSALIRVTYSTVGSVPASSNFNPQGLVLPVGWWIGCCSAVPWFPTLGSEGAGAP